MANDLTTAPQTPAPATRWSEPQLTTSLAELLEEKLIWAHEATLPVLGDEDRECATRVMEVYALRPRGSSPARISRCLGSAALAYPALKLTEQEAATRLKVYQHELGDIDADVLGEAFSRAVRTIKFFPSIAELREIAGKLPASPDRVRAYRLRQLLRASQPEEPVEMVTADQLADLRKSLSGATATARHKSTSEATAADYIALGLSEDDARTALAERQRLLRRTPERAAGECVAAGP